MWFFAHVGITVGVAAVVDSLFMKRLQGSGADAEDQLNRHQPLGIAAPDSKARWSAKHVCNDRQERKSNGLDYRVIAIGSVLPDVDKYISLIAFNSFDRGFFHTLLSTGILWLLGLLLFRSRRDTRLLQLAFCWTMHQGLDQMWINPRVLLWPFQGWQLDGNNLTFADFVGYMRQSLSTDPTQFVPEIIGAATIAGLLVLLASRRYFSGPWQSPGQNRQTNRPRILKPKLQKRK